MKIIIGSLSHESNSFNPVEMTIDEFSPVYGEDVFKRVDKAGESALLGIYQVLQQEGAQVMPTIFARATPGGLVSLEAYQELKDGFIRELKKAGNADGICLHLHGSMTVSGLGDAEGDLLTAVRTVVGWDVPIVVSLDMHATLTPAMMKGANAFVGYRTAPHVDMAETGQKAAKVLLDSLKGGYNLTMEAVGLPILISGEQSESNKEPMVSLIHKLEEIDSLPDVLASSLFLGFPWVDVSFNRGAAVVVTKEAPKLARNYAVRIADEFWQRLGEFKFTTEAYPFAKALEVSLEVEKGPVCIADCGDNPGAGGSQNIVYPLQLMLERNLENVLFGAIADPDVYHRCAKQAPGTKLTLELGKLSIKEDAPGLLVEAKILRVGLLGTTPAVAIQVDGVVVVVSEKRVMMLDPKDLANLGLQPLGYRLLVLKSGYLDPKYEAIATRGLLALTPGFTNQIFADLDYQNVKRPIHPLDRGFDYRPEEHFI